MSFLKGNPPSVHGSTHSLFRHLSQLQFMSPNITTMQWAGFCVCVLSQISRFWLWRQFPPTLPDTTGNLHLPHLCDGLQKTQNGVIWVSWSSTEAVIREQAGNSLEFNMQHSHVPGGRKYPKSSQEESDYWTNYYVSTNAVIIVTPPHI